MIPRVLEAEVMDGEAEAREYDTMDHSAVNRAFAADFLARCPSPDGAILDVGTGTAQIPIELCRQSRAVRIVAVDLSDAMLEIARKNTVEAGFQERIAIELADGSALPYPDGRFHAVVSNSIIHHIPEPAGCFAEMVRVSANGAAIFVRDLLRPDSIAELERLVQLHAADANERQRSLFRDSLHAALTLDEVRGFIVALGFPADTVMQTSDRHWTWSATAE